MDDLTFISQQGYLKTFYNFENVTFRVVFIFYVFFPGLSKDDVFYVGAFLEYLVKKKT